MIDLKSKLSRLQEPASKVKELTYIYKDRNGVQKEKSYLYVKYREYKIRMDEVFGCDGYTTEYTIPQYQSLPNGQQYLSCCCRITILNEDGRPLIYKEGLGGREIQFESNNKCSNLKNLPFIVQKHAFKSACREFSIFGYDCDDSCDEEDSAGAISKSSSSETGQMQNSSKDSKQSSSQQRIMQFKTDGDFFEVGQKNDRPILKIAVHEKIGNSLKQEKAEIIFYPNRYSKIAEKINRLQHEAKAQSVLLQLRVTEAAKRDGKRQYVFCAFE